MADQDILPSIEETASPVKQVSSVNQATEVEQATQIKQEFPIEERLQANQAFGETAKRKRDSDDAGDQPMRPWGMITVGTPPTSTYQSLALRVAAQPLPIGTSATRAPPGTPRVQPVPIAARPVPAIQPMPPLGYTPLAQAPPVWNPLPYAHLQAPQVAPRPAPQGNGMFLTPYH